LLGDIVILIAESATLRLLWRPEIIWYYCTCITRALLARHKPNSQQHLHDTQSEKQCRTAIIISKMVIWLMLP